MFHTCCVVALIFTLRIIWQITLVIWVHLMFCCYTQSNYYKQIREALKKGIKFRIFCQGVDGTEISLFQNNWHPNPVKLEVKHWFQFIFWKPTLTTASQRYNFSNFFNFNSNVCLLQLDGGNWSTFLIYFVNIQLSPSIYDHWFCGHLSKTYNLQLKVKKRLKLYHFQIWEYFIQFIYQLKPFSSL